MCQEIYNNLDILFNELDMNNLSLIKCYNFNLFHYFDILIWIGVKILDLIYLNWG